MALYVQRPGSLVSHAAARGIENRREPESNDKRVK